MKASSLTQHTESISEDAPILKLQNLSTGYGKKQVLFDVDFEVEGGQTVLVIGSNGSGKSTLFKAIYGLLPLWSGEVFFDGESLHNSKFSTPTSRLIKQGLMYIPQKDELFEDMTVAQNLEMSLLHLNDRSVMRQRIDETYQQIAVLHEKKNQTVRTLSGGERKLLSLGMVTANRPKMVLYDEALAGLSSSNVKNVLDLLQAIKAQGVTLVLIEHRIKQLIPLADRIVGLKMGRINTEKLDTIESIKTFMI